MNNMPEYMTRAEVLASAAFGNELARRIAANRPTNYDVTLRHIMAKDGTPDAIHHAMKLMNCDRSAAAKYIANLSKRNFT